MTLTRPQVRLLTYLDGCEHASEPRCAAALYGNKAMAGYVDVVVRALLDREGPALIRRYCPASRRYWSVAITPAGRRALREQPEPKESR